MDSFLNGPNPFAFDKFLIKTVGFSGIRTRIVEIAGEHVDHLTTITAQNDAFLLVETYHLTCNSQSGCFITA